MNSGNRNHQFDFRKKFVLNFSRDSERDHFPKKKDFLSRPHRPNPRSISFSQKSEHRTTSPGSILNFKFNNTFKETPPLHSHSSFIGKRDTSQFIHSSFPNYNLPIEKIETPKFTFKDPFNERKEIQPSLGSFSGYKPQNLHPNLASLEPIIKFSFADRFKKNYLAPVKPNPNMGYSRQGYINNSKKNDPINQCYFTSHENSLSYQDPQMTPIHQNKFGGESHRSRLSINSKYNQNLLSSMKPRLFPSKIAFQTKFSTLNFSNPNSRKCETFKPVHKLNLSFNDKNRPLEVIKCSELASKASQMSFNSILPVKKPKMNLGEMIKISATLSEKFNKVEPSASQEKAKLKSIVRDFEKDLEEDLDVLEEDRKALVLLLKFLFDFDIDNNDFEQLSDEYQSAFRKFIIDRYFKDEMERDNQIKFLYHDILVIVDEEKNKKSKKDDLIQKKDNLSKDMTLSNEVKFIKVQVKKYRKGILESIHPKYLKGFTKKSEKKELECGTVQMTSKFLLEGNPTIKLLQEYLRKRERLNLICRRRKKMHRKSLSLIHI